MKVLILVLSARRDPWGSLMTAQMETWDAEDDPQLCNCPPNCCYKEDLEVGRKCRGEEQTQTLYYCGRSDQPSTEKVFYSPALTESLEDVSPRTIEAFEHALTLDWDFMARCHSSTYVHKKNLVDFIETLPKENVLCGLLTTGEKPFLWGGGSYIISRDVIEKLVANKYKWNRGIMEDNALTNLAIELSIPMWSNGRMASINQVEVMEGPRWMVMCYGIGENFTFSDWRDINKAQPHFYFRCKQDLERHKDVEIFKLLNRHYD